MSEPTATADDRILRERAINVIGHALQTPMATLRSALDGMARTDDEARHALMLEVAQRTAHRMERLIDDALVAADVTTRLPTDRSRDVEVADLARQAWANLDPPPPPATTFDIEGDATVTTSADTLRWLLRLLLDNAARYGRTGVLVRVHPSRIEVCDDGEPLGDEELTHAFDLGYRGHAAVMAWAEGLGVGLGTARQLAAHLGATVTLANRHDADGIVATIDLGG